MDNRDYRFLWLLAAGLTAASPRTSLSQEANEANERNVHVRVGKRLTREDNLYRLPTGIEAQDLLGAEARSDDLVNSTSVALAGRWVHDDQEVVLDAAAAANRFADNGNLDNTSGSALLDWNWRLGSRWSGKTGGRRERALASFANTLSLDKDLLDTTSYHVDTRFAAGARWSALASARESTTSHDSEARRRDDVEIRSGAVGLEYRTPRENHLGLEYRQTRAEYPAQALVLGTGSASDYEERGANATLGYVLTDKVLLKASVGHVERTYELASRGDFSGEVWSAGLTWLPTESTQIALRRYRELKAHLDVESDHFVATGESVVATWMPIEKIGLSLQLSREEQRYIGAADDVLVGPARYDTPLLGSVRFTYTPGERTSLEVAYRDETRDSNRPRFDYDAAAVSIAGEFRF
jgi:hypothetical protein